MNTAFGTFRRTGSIKLSGIAGRGKVDEDQGSVGPGMKINWEDSDNKGKAAITSANALNPAK